MPKAPVEPRETFFPAAVTSDRGIGGEQGCVRKRDGWAFSALCAVWGKTSFVSLQIPPEEELNEGQVR